MDNNADQTARQRHCIMNDVRITR